MKQVRKKQYRKSNKVKMDKFDLFVVIMSAFTIGMLIQKIATEGISFMSTIRIFWIGGGKDGMDFLFSNLDIMHYLFICKNNSNKSNYSSCSNYFINSRMCLLIP